MNILSGLSTENIIALATTFIGAVALLNDKVRSFLLTPLKFLNSKAGIRKETSNAVMEVIDDLTGRVTVMHDDYLKLSEKLSVMQKDANEEKRKRINAEYSLTSILDRISRKCTNNCLEDVSEQHNNKGSKG